MVRGRLRDASVDGLKTAGEGARATRCEAAYLVRNGFDSRSSPIVVREPWPGTTTVSSGQRQYAVMQGTHDLLEVATWEIGATDASGKERISGNQLLFGRKQETG